MRLSVLIVVVLIHFCEGAVNVLMPESIPYSGPSVVSYIPSSDVNSAVGAASAYIPNPTVPEPTNYMESSVSNPSIYPNNNVGNSNIAFTTYSPPTTEDYIYIDIDEDPIIKKRLKLLCTITREKLKRKNLPQERIQKLKNRLKNRCSQFE
ncbi:PREDICTED: uncharacterized protein LOC108563416 [Nicrophorus vespilloides]|uniref:Uncharacterized protein LOC108563416 n=1 Tax=Nicrophorus vespilloides TaxID=110193 RepID=A0ABM1MSM5_NICVS|nr:PREDICTED: uncharacterized protein LOC108563416 [Nicrophorus vespilloides]